MARFESFQGIVIRIDDLTAGNRNRPGCNKLFTVSNRNGRTINFIISPRTYFVDNALIQVGDPIIGFYDAAAPATRIFPPQFRAVVIARVEPVRTVKVDFFNRQLLSSDNTLRLNIGPSTQIITENGQAFAGSPGNRNLTVIYSISTMSIPAQTTPERIIVMC